MGVKGDKLTGAASISAEELEAKLGHIDGITTKKMFGGYGIFHDSKMFGLINSRGEGFLKVSEATQQKFEAAGSHRHSKMPYFSIPEAVFADHDQLSAWAQEAIEGSK